MKAILLMLALAQVPGVEDAAPEQGAYFAKGPFRAAQRLVAQGAHRQAVTLLQRLLREYPDAKERPQARYLLGLSLIRVGEYGEAAQLFDQLATSYPVLRDEHLFQRGRALYLWQSYLDAARVLAQVDPEGPHGVEARRLRAWALLYATDFDRLARWLAEEDAQADLPPELRLVWARARHRTGDVLGAYRAFRQAWQEAEEPAVAGPALLGLTELEIGDKPLLPEAERAAVRATRGLDLGDPGQSAVAGSRDPQAREQLLTALAKLEDRLARVAPRGRLLAEAAFTRGRLLVAARRFRGAAEHLARAERLAPSDAVELRARVALTLGRTQEWLGQEATALATYEQMASRFADRPESEEALFRASEIQLRSRKYKEARGRCEALLLKNPVTPYRRRCLWSIGWGHYRLGEEARAHEFFSALTRMSLPADLDAASRYWLARTEARLGHPAEARAGFLEVLRRQPLGYYAALAQAQLVERPEDPEAAPDGPREAEGEVPKALVRAREYARLGLAQEALQAARGYEQAARAEARPIPEAAFFALADLYEELGQRREARRVRQEGALEHPAALGSDAFFAAAQRAMPMQFEDEVRAAADEFGLPHELLFGLVRTESGFRPEAVSAMSAYGLAQLILPTARQMAGRVGVGAGRVTRRRLLTDPALNVRLGAAYVRTLLDTFEGSEPLALAAYNAGPEAVRAWMDRRVRTIAGVKGRGLGVLPAADELAEEIPVAETRAFVKAVLARARGYAILYPKPEARPVVAPDIPESAALSEPTALPAAPDPQDGLPKGLTVRLRAWAPGS